MLITSQQRSKLLFASIAAVLAGYAGAPSLAAAAPHAQEQAADAAQSLLMLHDEMVEEMLPYDLSLRNLLGKPISILPPDSLAQWQAVANRASHFKARLKAIDAERLGDNDRLTRSFLINLAQSLEAFPGHWLYSFPVTPYAGGWRHNAIRQSALSTPLTTEAERARYIQAMKAYSRYIGSQKDKLLYQAKMGIRVAQPAIEGARRVVANQIPASDALVPKSERLSGMPAAEARQFSDQVRSIVDNEIKPAFRDLQNVLNDNYFAKAPEQAGLRWQPGGSEQYRRLVQLNTNTSLSPQEIHDIGKDILANALAELDAIKIETGFKGTNREFASMVDADPRFSAKTPQEVEAHFANAMKRIEPVLPRYFSLLPKAPYAVERAPPQIEQGMTFGYYRAPTPEVPVGAYLYNGSNPGGTSYANAAALIFHELLPGHHFQIALQLENKSLPALRRASSFAPLTAYVEGWAEYAADLADEMGMYQTPYERYGRLYSKMFLANRLVVDTGLNELGWTLEQARAFMQANTFASQAEIDSELLRYSTDIPGQALAYAMGQRELLRMRDEAQKSMGKRFTFPAFHAEVLAPGALPLDLLDQRIKDWSGAGR